ncbi:AraC family transcriptional regulator [Neorhizobium lilium]|uniref:AraC family transcriptional regulator n=1 Tax=Neorhizobium lilium TaxID=2503024 RepID=A0A444LLG1_9HYPH|nr:AraC family transcriptional regulator [Neorhizobium lilium]RWX81112.1 AraC family transcriptional regulator [Neorhizobium lilium]
MPFVPLSFVVAILLLVLFGASVRQLGEERPANRPLLALILVSAFLSLLSGLRWGYGVQGAIMYLAPVSAAAVPPLAYVGVTKLVRRSRAPLANRLILHALPMVAIVVLLATWRDPIDMALVLIFLGYAVAILLLMRTGTDALRLAPFEEAVPAYQAILFAALALLFSAAVDTFVFVDMTWMRGEHTPPLIAVGNLASLVLLSIAAATASRSQSATETIDATAPTETYGDKETLAAVETLMAMKHVYRDADLNLDRMARKLGVPARQVSVAINRATGKNVSQYVNEHRIAEACELLVETDKAVTEIMFEVGFQTKSNFNREFRRVTEMSPLEWREQKARAARIAIKHDP